MARLHETIQRYLDRANADAAATPVREISVEALTKMERRLDWKTHVVSSQEFEEAKFVFDRVVQPAHSPTLEELEQLTTLFDKESLAELGRSRTKSVRGTCACGRDLSIFDVIVKALGNSAHSIGFMREVMSGERGHFLICGTDGTSEDRAKLPTGTIWVENTQPTECVACGEPHQLLVVMSHMAHHWVLKVPDDPDGPPLPGDDRPVPDEQPQPSEDFTGELQP